MQVVGYDTKLPYCEIKKFLIFCKHSSIFYLNFLYKKRIFYQSEFNKKYSIQGLIKTKEEHKHINYYMGNAKLGMVALCYLCSIKTQYTLFNQPLILLCVQKSTFFIELGLIKYSFLV